MKSSLVLIEMLSLLLIGCSSSAPSRISSSSEISPELNRPVQANVEQKNWAIDTTSSPIDGTKTVTLGVRSMEGDANLIIRFTGSKLEIYVATSEIVNDERASVRIKFDETVPNKQTWNRSADYKALFSPQPYPLLAKLQHASRFYIEFHPYQKVPETLAFDIAGLSSAIPQEVVVMRKKDRDGIIALRSKISSHVHACSQTKNNGTLMYPEQWCWTDPDSENFRSDLLPFPTKEEAIKNALEMARAGHAFKEVKRQIGF